MADLDALDRALMHYLVAYIDDHHYPPTQRDIRRALGVASTSTVAARLRRLQALGYVDQEPGQPRTLRVLREVP